MLVSLSDVSLSREIWGEERMVYEGLLIASNKRKRESKEEKKVERGILKDKRYIIIVHTVFIR